MKTVQLGVRMDPKLKRELEKAAQKQKVTTSWLATRMIEKGLEHAEAFSPRDAA